MKKSQIKKILKEFCKKCKNTGFDIIESYDWLTLKKSCIIKITSAVSYTDYDEKTLNKCYELFKEDLTKEGYELIIELEEKEK